MVVAPCVCKLFLTRWADAAHTEIRFCHLVIARQLKLGYYTLQTCYSIALRAMKMNVMVRMNMLVPASFACVAFRKSHNTVEMNHSMNVAFIFQSIQHSVNRYTIAHTLCLFLYF
jgi:hypothetical protein